MRTNINDWKNLNRKCAAFCFHTQTFTSKLVSPVDALVSLSYFIVRITSAYRQCLLLVRGRVRVNTLQTVEATNMCCGCVACSCNHGQLIILLPLNGFIFTHICPDDLVIRGFRSARLMYNTFHFRTGTFKEWMNHLALHQKSQSGK